MPLTLHVDSDAWAAHLRSYLDEHPGLVPVTKGNGYGFGNTVLAAEAAALGVHTIAVGTYDDAARVTATFPGDLLVLSPWRPGVDLLTDDHLVHTVSRLTDLHELAARTERPRLVVEVLTTIRRHGIAEAEIEDALPLLDGVRFEGWALHLPLAGDRLDQARRLAGQLVPKAGGPLWVSHLGPDAAAALQRETSTDVRLRVGTALWLGRPQVLHPRATVLDVHRLVHGEPYGYRQRRARRSGTLLVLAGGTAHGIALEAPAPAVTVRQRAISVATGALDAFGRALSPFSVAGRKRWFAEPPHMQCSLVWLPTGVPVPAVGDEVDVDVRLTTTTFDRIAWD